MGESVRDYLAKWGLDAEVKLQNGEWSTVDLSRGQRKRLALLSIYLEDRPILVFDEWAADQDPVFKSVFYCEFLPLLKRHGKTAIVITHDDRYFHTGDRLVRFDAGKIIEVNGPKNMLQKVL
jgi:putative ATP-binding cassette transporter